MCGCGYGWGRGGGWIPTYYVVGEDNCVVTTEIKSGMVFHVNLVSVVDLFCASKVFLRFSTPIEHLIELKLCQICYFNTN